MVADQSKIRSLPPGLPLPEKVLNLTAYGCVLLGVLALGVLALPATAENQTYFKIVTKSGSVELKATITPEEAKRGYSIVTLGGHVVEEVAAELTSDEYAAQTSAQRAAEEAKLKKAQEQAYDEALLLRYSAVEDLLAEKKRKLSEFDIRISILYNNLAGLKEKLDIQQARAAGIERRGNEVPKYIVDNINDLESELQELETAIKLRQTEKSEVDRKYDADATRLETLIAKFQR